MQKNPVISISKAAEITGLSFPTASKSIQYLMDLGIVREITGKQTRRLYSYDNYIKILSEGTEPL